MLFVHLNNCKIFIWSKNQIWCSVTQVQWVNASHQCYSLVQESLLSVLSEIWLKAQWWWQKMGEDNIILHKNILFVAMQRSTANWQVAGSVSTLFFVVTGWHRVSECVFKGRMKVVAAINLCYISTSYLFTSLLFMTTFHETQKLLDHLWIKS